MLFPIICKLLVFSFFVSLAESQWDPHFVGNRNTIVHLFEWKWRNIADECEQFLFPRGYAGVQTSPVTENVLELVPFRPWSERYTPVSYQIFGRSGNESEFASMVRRCNAVGVRVYVDIVLNHMSGSGSCCVGTAGSNFDPRAKVFPAVPFGPEDFHWQGPDCTADSGQIEDWQDPSQIRNCELGTLLDLNQGRANVQDRIVEFLNKLVDHGVAGFRVDAAKHMWPGDLEAIFNRLHNLPTSAGFPVGAKPFIVMEVWDHGTDIVRSTEYFHMGRTTEFQWGMFVGDVFRGYTPLRNLWNFGLPWGLYPSDNVLVFVDNHDNQRYQGGFDTNILTFRDKKRYVMAQAFTQAWPYGVKRQMSSYYWETNWQDGHDLNSWFGPPNTNGEINDVVFNNDLSCGGGWVCEHRWREIFNMVQFANTVTGTIVTNWWDNGNNHISFCRGNRGFIAFNNEDAPLSRNLQTCLPAGTYCDVISGSKYNGSCSGKSVTVSSNGEAFINIYNTDEVPVIAIHIDSKL